MIITIDGTSGTGKSTVAKRLAEKLGYTYYNTGAMYRAVAYGVHQENIDWQDEASLAQFLAHFSLDFRGNHLFYQGVDISQDIKEDFISELASKLSTLPSVRKKLVVLQHAYGKEGDAVFEGRDMGSVVFPGAECKFFLTASAEVRAKRRFLELQTIDPSANYDTILKAIQKRDKRDETRAHSPLVCPKGAHTLDTDDLTIDQVVDTLFFIVSK